MADKIIYLGCSSPHFEILRHLLEQENEAVFAPNSLRNVPDPEALIHDERKALKLKLTLLPDFSRYLNKYKKYLENPNMHEKHRKKRSFHD